jgi:nitrogen-specific signal transduction histidine kinase
MRKEKNNIEITATLPPPVTGDFFEKLWDESWVYIKTVVDVVREPVLILDKNLCVMAANDPFYRTFQVDRSDTEGKTVYKLGNGQWNIPALRELLEQILPHNTFFNGFEVNHVFPSIGRKVMLLNARQIHYQEDLGMHRFPSIILLAFEDVTDMMSVAQSVAEQIKQFQMGFSERTERLELQVAHLEKKINKIKT